tara:strand:- start:324 stop:518 length:195 start_codon:yes stop_codon:yes gene_type:complete
VIFQIINKSYVSLTSCGLLFTLKGCPPVALIAIDAVSKVINIAGTIPDTSALKTMGWKKVVTDE